MDREYCENFCKKHNLSLSSMADKVIEKVNKKDELCPCRIKPTPCPCDELFDDIKKTGRCTCNLYTKKEENE